MAITRMAALGLLSGALGEVVLLDKEMTESLVQVAAVDPSRVGVETVGKSGKFTLYNKDLGATGDPNQVTIEVAFLRELKADGGKLTGANANLHSIEAFASQDFTITPAEEVTTPFKASRTTLQSPVNNVGVLKVETSVLAEDASVGPDSKKWSGKAGDVKWNIDLSDWKWHTDGAMIEVGIEVKSKGGKTSGDADDTEDLGGGISMELTKEVTLDGTAGQLVDGYPKIEAKENKKTYVFMFPKFNENGRAVYDPLITMSGSDSFDSFGVSAAPSSGFLLMLAVWASRFF